MLSGGMKQRVAIARGMAMEPDVLLMDEPFAALDALTRRKMQDELLRLWEDTRFTVLFVTHSIEEAIRIGTRILLLSPHPGEVKAELNSVPVEAMGTAHASRARKPASTTCCSRRIEMETTDMTDLLTFRPEIIREVNSGDAPVVAKTLSVFERVYRLGFVRKAVILAVARHRLGGLWPMARQSAAVPNLRRDPRGFRQQHRKRHHPAAHAGLAADIGYWLQHRYRAGRAADDAGDRLAHRGRSARRR